jgi:hypothetical protein
VFTIQNTYIFVVYNILSGSVYEMLWATSEKDALLEAWLIDGAYLKEAEKYKVLSIDEAKNSIKELVEKEDYELAQKLAEFLKNKINLSDKEVLRSYRISFAPYLSVVQTALRKSTSLGAIVKNFIAEDLTRIVDSIQKRKISDERKKLVKDTFENWKEQLPKQSSYSKEEFIISSTLSATDIPSSVAQACQAEFLKKVRTELANIPAVLERYLEAIGVKEAEDENEILKIELNPELFEIHLKTNEDGLLQISLTFTNYLGNSQMSDAEFEALGEELKNDFGDEAIDKLFEVHEAFFTPEGPFFEIELFTGIIELIDGKLLLNDVEVASYPPKQNYDYDKIKETLLKDFSLHIEQLKKDLEESLQANNYDKIIEITKKLSDLQNRGKLADFSLDVITKLLQRKTQIISLRIPEMLIFIWEAKKPNKFESFLEVKD